MPFISPTRATYTAYLTGLDLVTLIMYHKYCNYYYYHFYFYFYYYFYY